MRRAGAAPIGDGTCAAPKCLGWHGPPAIRTVSGRQLSARSLRCPCWRCGDRSVQTMSPSLPQAGTP